MQVVTIEDAINREDPFLDGWDEPETIIYHGTSNAYTVSIETAGLNSNVFQEMCGDVIHQIVSCDQFHIFPDGLDAAKGYGNQHRVHFTRKFRLAREYASNRGGERVNGAFRAGAGLCGILSSSSEMEKRIQHWTQVMKNNGPHAPTQRVLSNLQNAELREQCLASAQKALSNLEGIFRDAYPVVYVVRANLDWLPNLDLDWEKATGIIMEPSGGYALSEITLDRILARIEYPGGIDPKSW